MTLDGPFLARTPANFYPDLNLFRLGAAKPIPLENGGQCALVRYTSDSWLEKGSPMRGFSWIEQGRIAGMPKPGDWSRIEDDLAFLKAQGIRLLFTLTESPLDSDLLARYDIVSVHLPVADFTPPDLTQLSQFVQEARVALGKNKAVGVHCRAGIGRTGTFLAAWLIANGSDAASAISQVRRLRPGSIETREQEKVLYSFAKAISNPGSQ